MSLGIDTGVEKSSEVPLHSHRHSWCYLLDFFPNHRLQLNQITRTMFVYFSFQIDPKEEIARAKIGWTCGPRNNAAVRDDVLRKGLPLVKHVLCAVCAVAPSCWNKIPWYQQQARLAVVAGNFPTFRCNEQMKWLLQCRPRLRRSKGPKHQILLQLTKS